MTDNQPSYLPSMIIAAVDDMFFAAKIRSTAGLAERRIEFVKSIEQLMEQVRKEPPFLVIVDLNSSRVSPIELISKLKSEPSLKAVPAIGFLSHVQVALKQQAEQAGYDFVLPRSIFTQRLAEILSGKFFESESNPG